MLVAGVDEVGRGSLAGPVIAAAVILVSDDIPGLKDSKKLSKAELKRLDRIIRKEAIAYSVGKASVQEIEEINILQASLLAMARAIKALQIKPNLVLVDGNQVPDIPYSVKSIIKGDNKVKSIMAASILAKVARDKLMLDLDKDYPLYYFKNNKGYPTKIHLQSLVSLGPCEHHRRTFKPVKNIDNINNNESK